MSSRDLPYIRQVAPELNAEIAAPSGMAVKYLGATEYRGEDIAAVHEFLVSVAGAVAVGVPAAVIAEWIVAKFRGRAERVTINRRQIDLDDAGQVRRIVEEEIRVESTH